MFEVLKVCPPSQERLLLILFREGTILMKGTNNKWYEADGVNGLNITWEQVTPKDYSQSKGTSMDQVVKEWDMDDLKDRLVIADSVGVWYYAES